MKWNSWEELKGNKKRILSSLKIEGCDNREYDRIGVIEEAGIFVEDGEG